MSADRGDDLVRGLFDRSRSVEAKRQRQAALAAALGAAPIPIEDADDPDLLDEIAALVAERLGRDRDTESEPAPDFLTGAVLHAEGRRQAFTSALLRGGPSAPAAEDVPRSSGFDGGARERVPRQPPTLEERTRAALGRAHAERRGGDPWHS